jgi:hypothetical protein
MPRLYVASRIGVRDQDPNTAPGGQSMNAEWSENRRICGYRLYAGVRNEQRMAAHGGEYLFGSTINWECGIEHDIWLPGTRASGVFGRHVPVVPWPYGWGSYTRMAAS